MHFLLFLAQNFVSLPLALNVYSAKQINCVYVGISVRFCDCAVIVSFGVFGNTRPAHIRIFMHLWRIQRSVKYMTTGRDTPNTPDRRCANFAFASIFMNIFIYLLKFAMHMPKYTKSRVGLSKI